MNKTQKSQLKKIALPTILFMIIGFMAILLVEISIILALVLEIINFIVYLFLIFIKLNDYKIRFLFLGKKYKNQLNNYLIKNNISIESINKHKIKYEKRTYRKTGKAFNFVSTPYTKIQELYVKHQFTDVNGEFAIDNPNLDLLILSELYFKMNSGAGLYGLFEAINLELSYGDFCKTINDSKHIEKRIKSLLLNKQLEQVYYLINNEKEISEEENKMIEIFESTLSIFKNDDLMLLNTNFINMAIELYIDEESVKFLNQNIVSLWIDRRKRIQIIKNESSYTAIIEEFVFWLECGDCELYNSGSFVETYETIGLYLTEELLIEDNKSLFNTFSKIDYS